MFVRACFCVFLVKEFIVKVCEQVSVCVIFGKGIYCHGLGAKWKPLLRCNYGFNCAWVCLYLLGKERGNGGKFNKKKYSEEGAVQILCKEKEQENCEVNRKRKAEILELKIQGGSEMILPSNCTIYLSSLIYCISLIPNDQG